MTSMSMSRRRTIVALFLAPVSAWSRDAWSIGKAPAPVWASMRYVCEELFPSASQRVHCDRASSGRRQPTGVGR